MIHKLEELPNFRHHKTEKISFPLKKGLDATGLLGFLQLLFTITWKSTLGAIR
jgi:hypothetical protein